MACRATALTLYEETQSPRRTMASAYRIRREHRGAAGVRIYGVLRTRPKASGQAICSLQRLGTVTRWRSRSIAMRPVRRWRVGIPGTCAPGVRVDVRPARPVVNSRAVRRGAHRRHHVGAAPRRVAANTNAFRVSNRRTKKKRQSSASQCLHQSLPRQIIEDGAGLRSSRAM